MKTKNIRPVKLEKGPKQKWINFLRKTNLPKMEVPLGTIVGQEPLVDDEGQISLMATFLLSQGRDIDVANLTQQDLWLNPLFKNTLPNFFRATSSRKNLLKLLTIARHPHCSFKWLAWYIEKYI